MRFCEVPWRSQKARRMRTHHPEVVLVAPVRFRHLLRLIQNRTAPIDGGL